MGMKAKFARAVERIFTAFDDIPESVTYTAMNDQVFNETTQQVERGVVTYKVDMIISELSSETLQLYTDVFQRAEFPSFYFHTLQGIFRQAQLINSAGVNVEPQKGDKITRPNGLEYTVVEYLTDPALATWTIVFHR